MRSRDRYPLEPSAAVNLGLGLVLVLGVLGGSLSYASENSREVKNFLTPGRAERLKVDYAQTGGIDLEKISNTAAFIVRKRESAEVAVSEDKLGQQVSWRVAAITGCERVVVTAVTVQVDRKSSTLNIATADCPPQS